MLKHRRADFKGTAREVNQADVAFAIGQSQSQVSKIERGAVDLSTWRPEVLYDLFLAYRFAPSDMLSLADEYSLRTLESYLSQRSKLYNVREGVKVPYLGVIAAGPVGGEDEGEAVNVPDVIAVRYRLEDVFAATITSDTILSDDARDCIPPDSLAYFHTKLTPEHGELVCAYLPAQDHSVIKRWHPTEEYTVLRSRTGKHPPIVLETNDEVILQGVYLTHLPMSARLRG